MLHNTNNAVVPINKYGINRETHKKHVNGLAAGNN